jgi:uncharacterized spore protein YtfJ
MSVNNIPATETPPSSAVGGILQQLAEKLGSQARASAVFAHPIEKDGITVIPVAKARWGFGGGSGRDRDQQRGSGGGGGVAVTPVGYIEIRNGTARYRPIVDPAALLPTIVAVVLSLSILRRLLSSARRARR